MVEDKEVVSTIVAGGLGLGALVLVFLGFSLSELETLLDSSRQHEYRWRIRVLRAVIGLAGVVVMLGVTTSGTGMGWLLGKEGFYDATVAMFFVALGLTVALTFGAVLQALI